MGGIVLSQKYGLNPCLSRCLYCGETKNELALFGSGLKQFNKQSGRMETIEAPREGMILDHEPCEACVEKWSAGIAILEVAPQEVMTGGVSSGVYERTRPNTETKVLPTGAVAVLSSKS